MKYEDNILEDNTFVYCYNDITNNKDCYNSFEFVKGRMYLIRRYDPGDDTYLISTLDDDDNGDWFYNSLEAYYNDSNDEDMPHIWEYFIEIKQRGNRIRKIAKQFIK